MRQILLAYKELYDLGLVHRDLKLSNFMLQQGQVKLGDFGFAVPIFDCVKEFSYNAGSPAYMAPESLKRNRFSFESDIWALGVIAFELVFGHVPVREKFEVVQYESVMSFDVRDKLRTRPDLSQGYQQFIEQCLQTDMRKRALAEDVIHYSWPQA
jgi:serine/threonine protein kinase